MRKSIFFSIFLPILLLYGQELIKPWKEIPQADKEALVAYLKANWKTPEDYVIEKFFGHDLVFIGEYHRIKHDVELIHQLIPRLYAAGIRNLAIEFGCHEDQDKVDKLINSPYYDEDLARRLMFNCDPLWGYIEYMDIYRKAWELNKSLPQDKPRFRVVHLSYRPNWSVLSEEMTPELWKKIWHKGNSDEFMAQIILDEFVSKKEKALIYSGSHHAFTRYQQPIYDFEKKKFTGFVTNRMGNIVYQKIPDKVFNIFLHSPWIAKANPNEHNYPLGGVIDLVMSEFNEKRVGFDVVNSPFAKIKDTETYYSIGYDEFTLGTFCDGYIFQKHFKDYEGCTVDEKFITAENFPEAIASLPNLQARKLITKPEMLVQAMKDDANMKKRFRDLK